MSIYWEITMQHFFKCHVYSSHHKRCAVRFFPLSPLFGIFWYIKMYVLYQDYITVFLLCCGTNELNYMYKNCHGKFFRHGSWLDFGSSPKILTNYYVKKTTVGRQFPMHRVFICRSKRMTRQKKETQKKSQQPVAKLRNKKKSPLLQIFLSSSLTVTYLFSWGDVLNTCAQRFPHFGCFPFSPASIQHISPLFILLCISQVHLQVSWAAPLFSYQGPPVCCPATPEPW